MTRLAEGLVQDVRTSVRSLTRSPLVALTVLLTVGLGAGATASMFAAVDAAMLRPLPYADPDELVRIFTDAPPYRFRFSLVDYQALEAQQTHFSSVAAYTERQMSFSDGVQAERVRGKAVSWRYFEVLRIQPFLGRPFDERDTVLGAPPAVIVSHRFWRERLGARADAIGRPVRLDGADHLLVGVLPASVGPLEYRQDFFVAAQWPPPQRKGPFSFIVIARLPAGRDAAAAAAELRAINRRLFPLWKASYQDERATWGFMDLKRYLLGDSGPTALMALAAVALVWLLASTNSANLMIARVVQRQRELAVRSALGASRSRVVRHVLVEQALLAAGAAVVAVLIAWVGVELVKRVGADYLPRTEEIGLDARVLGLLGLLALATAVLCGVPAVRATGRSEDLLHSGGRTATGSAAAQRLRQLLIAGEFAVATPLLIAAALLAVTLNELRQVDVGFDPRHLLTGSIQLPAAQYPDEPRREAFWQELHREVVALPGVVGAAFADGLPPDDVGNFNNFDLEERPAAAGQSQPVTPWIAVTPEYFGVLGITLLEGRLLDERDGRQGAPPVVVVDRAWAKRFFPTTSAVGKRLHSGGCSTCPWTTVVGVVSEVKYAGLDQPDEGSVYTPLSGSRFRNLVLRTATAPGSLAAPVRDAVRRLDPTLPVSAVATVEERLAQSVERRRVLSLLVTSFAAVALALSIIGIYGVMAYAVQQQVREMAIRLALGGRPRDVLWLVMRRGGVLLSVGVAAGMGLAVVLTRSMSSVLFGVAPADVRTFVGVAAFLLGIGALACLVPGRRAMRLEPAVVLRNE